MSIQKKIKPLSLSSFSIKNGRSGYKNFTSDGNAGNDKATIAFPDFTIMSCDGLKAHINDLNFTLNAPTDVIKDPEWISAYKNEIERATNHYNAKGCSVNQDNQGIIKLDPLPPPDFPNPVIGITTDGTTVKTVNTTTVVGTTDNGKPVVATTGDGGSKFPWVWVAAAVAGAYLFFGGSGNSN